jgi:hypothetical protein
MRMIEYMKCNVMGKKNEMGGVVYFFQSIDFALPFLAPQSLL